MVRRAERSLRDQARAGIEHAGHGVNLGGFERFFKRERGKDGGQPLGQHGFARAGRADHQNVVAAGGGHFEGALGGLLAAHIAEVDGEVLELAEDLFGRNAEGFALNHADHRGVEQVDDVEQRGDGIDVDTFDNCRFSRVGSREDEIGNPFFAGQDSHRQHAGDGAHTAVEAELADQQEFAEVVVAQRAVGAQDADRDGKIEPRAFFFQVRGGEIDGDEGGRDQVAGVLNGRAHAVATLAHGCIGQAHGVEVVLIADRTAVVDFHVD